MDMALFERAADESVSLYYRVTHPIRQLAQHMRYRLAPRTLATCQKCGAVALWHYVPLGPEINYCDDCVPRGCDCNIIDRSIQGQDVWETDDEGREVCWVDYGDLEPAQYKDEQGRLLPCCEYGFFRWGLPRAFARCGRPLETSDSSAFSGEASVDDKRPRSPAET